MPNETDTEGVLDEPTGHAALSAEVLRRFTPEQKVRATLDAWLNDLRPDLGNLLKPGEIHAVTSVVGTLGRTCLPPRATETAPDVDVVAHIERAIGDFISNLPTNLPLVEPEAVLVIVGRLPNLKAALVAALKE